MYDANLGHEALPTQNAEVMREGVRMEEAPMFGRPLLVEEVMDAGSVIEKDPQPLGIVEIYESYNVLSPGTLEAIDKAAGPKDYTDLLHAKYGGKDAADEVSKLQKPQTERDITTHETSVKTIKADNSGFMSKIANFAGDHPVLTTLMGAGAATGVSAVAAEVARGASDNEIPAAKVGSPTAGSKNSEASTSTVSPCEDDIENQCSYDPPTEETDKQPQPEKPDNPSDGDDGQGGNQGNNRGDNLLPVPEKKTRRHWATKIINELRKGKQGRISASPEAKKDLYQARRGQCSKAEQKPSACPKLDKSLLKVLYKASFYKEFYIWHFTSGPHVPNSHHWRGDGVDLRKRNGKAPTNKSMFPIIRRVAPRNKSLEMIGPGDDQYHTGKRDGHWHIAVY